MAPSSTSSPHHGDVSTAEIAVVMFPLPAQGHLNQLLQLSRVVTTYNIPVHYVSTPIHIKQSKARIQGWDPLGTPNMHFHEFPIPEFSSPSLDPNAENKFPSHLMPLFGVVSNLRHPIAALLRSLSENYHRVVVIHDSLMASVVQDVATIPNAESYIFHSVSVFCTFFYFWEGMGKPFPVEGCEQVPSMQDCLTQEFEEFYAYQMGYFRFSSGNLFNSNKVVEGKYLNLIKKLTENDKKPHWALGPFNQVKLTNKNTYGLRHECLKWLDKQDPNSVIFVSFGTTTSLPEDQIKELAVGLENSGLKFIWVLRDADRADCKTDQSRMAQLPDGFDERIQGKGVILRDWAPQLDILAHYAVGGFLSHCGWNSCMESISMGVPIATWPMHSDQPRNAVLLTNMLGVGVVVKDWTKRAEIVTAEIISTTLRKLMASKEGEEIQRKAMEFGGDVRRAVAEGGDTQMEFDSFIASLSRK